MKNKILSICIAGNTNVGKSAFLNKLIGKDISIVNKKKNTTIESIIGIYTIKKTQIIFYDTPGLDNNKFNQNKNIKIHFWNSIILSDIILYFLDSSKKFVIDKNIIKKVNNENKKIIFVLNKIDLIKKSNLLPIINNLNNNYKIHDIFPISVKKEIGIQNLLNSLLKLAFIGDWHNFSNKITNKSDYFLSTEITRNSLLKFLNQEIPYKLKVENSKWIFVKKKEIVIHQNILINYIKYKKIILGKNGMMIKKIRQHSQKQLCNFFDKKVHLYLKVEIIK